MSDWIPLFQTLVWPLFLAIVLFLMRKQLATVVKSIASRIEGGDPFEAGPTGISFGQAERKLTRIEGEPSTPTPRGPQPPEQYLNTVYLVHHVTGVMIDADGVERREVLVILDSDSGDILNNVTKVVYHLHPSFPKPDREVSSRSTRFELRARAWGEFNLSADVHFEGVTEPLKLYRYIDFPWPALRGT